VNRISLWSSHWFSQHRCMFKPLPLKLLHFHTHTHTAPEKHRAAPSQIYADTHALSYTHTQTHRHTHTYTGKHAWAHTQSYRFTYAETPSTISLRHIHHISLGDTLSILSPQPLPSYSLLHWCLAFWKWDLYLLPWCLTSLSFLLPFQSTPCSTALINYCLLGILSFPGNQIYLYLSVLSLHDLS
jgi:hypothetical protein